jgi:predicted RNase H-like nuclease
MTDMPRIAGIDGCRGGWLVVCETPLPGPWSWFVAPNFEAVWRQLRDFDAVGVDMPVGIPDRGPRECEALARRLLSPRRTASVFSSPIRPILAIDDYMQACDTREAIDGRRMSKQSFFIMEKIAEIDAVVRARREFADRLFEVHPEVSFTALGGGEPMLHPKRDQAGFEERLEHLSDVFPRSTLEEALDAFPRAEVARDDVLDAFAVLWSAKRIALSTAERLPEDPTYDACGIDMAIWY